jgi:hypothetical protein
VKQTSPKRSTCFQSKHESALEHHGRDGHEGRDVVLSPNLVGSISVVQAFNAHRWSVAR